MTVLNRPNRTLEILQKAAQGRYGVLAVIAYNIEQLTALVRAAEANRSPLIILLFPSSVLQLPSLPFAAAAAVEHATVPLSLHLDHAQDAEQIRHIASTMPFDSIMVDMSHHEKAVNLTLTKELTELLHSRGIAVEGEAGRINGGEEGIADTGSLKALLTSASDAEDFLATGIDILAPSIGNIHGDYGPLGPQLDYDRLSSISEQVKGRAEVALHGTNDFTPAIMQECIDRGAIKLNINKLILEQWSIFFRENAAKLSLTDLMDGGMNVLQAQVEKWMNICGSVGKA